MAETSHILSMNFTPNECVSVCVSQGVLLSLRDSCTTPSAAVEGASENNDPTDVILLSEQTADCGLCQKLCKCIF